MENELNEILAEVMKKSPTKQASAGKPMVGDPLIGIPTIKSPTAENLAIGNAIADVSIVDGCPKWLPKKFWKDGQVNAQGLAKSYQHLERKLSSAYDSGDNLDANNGNDGEHLETAEGKTLNQNNESNQDSTDIGDSNEVSILNPVQAIIRDSEMAKTLTEQGLDEKQIEAVYDLADEHLRPIINRIHDLNTQVMEQELSHHFGSAKNWQTVQENMINWANANLPAETVEHLGSSVSGIKVLHKMMESNAEIPLSESGKSSDGLTEEKLRTMMDDPRYWRTKDQAYIQKVQQGFKELFSNG